MPRRMIGPLERSVRRDLRRVLPEYRTGGVAVLALELAALMDRTDVFLPARDIAALSAQLRGVLETLAKLQEPAAVLDPVDELARKRRERRVGSG